MDNCKILIATHKEAEMPKFNIYEPIMVGAYNKENIIYTPDNIGDNISNKNPMYCELTALYYGWKNIECEYLGLVHYRRLLMYKKKSKDKLSNVLNDTEAEMLVSQYKILVPKKRKYYIETIYSHYKHTFHKEHLDETKNIIEKLYPEYLKVFNKTMKKSSAYMFNMMVLKKELLNDYCEWLFNILNKLEEKFKNINYDDFDMRYCGRVGEILFNVWLNKKLEDKIISKNDICELKWFYIGKVSKIKKIKSFLMAKFFNKKYKGSF